MIQETTNEREAFDLTRPAIDVEDLILKCIPGGDSCDPQRVADAIREYAAALAVPLEARSRVASACASAEQALTNRGVFKGAHGLRGLLDAREFWDKQPYGTRLYYGDGGADYLHIGVLRAAVEALDASPAAPAEVQQTNADSVHLALPPAAAVVEFPSRGIRVSVGELRASDGTTYCVNLYRNGDTDPIRAMCVLNTLHKNAAEDEAQEWREWLGAASPQPAPPSTAAVPPESNGLDSSAPPSLQAVDTGGVALPRDPDTWARTQWPERQLHDNGSDTPLLQLVRKVWAAASGVHTSYGGRQ
jgi:hypothetical protein